MRLAATALLARTHSMNVKNKSAVIAGAARGVGKATALALATLGCNVANPKTSPTPYFPSSRDRTSSPDKYWSAMAALPSQA